MQLRQKTVLVTGAAGFLGSHLSERFLRDDYNVIGVDNFSTGEPQNRQTLEKLGKEKFLFIQADVSQEWSWLNLVPVEWLRNLEIVFHFASPASPKYFRTMSLEIVWANVLGLQNSLKTAERYKAKVIFASTSEIYGNPDVHPQPESYFGSVNSFGMRACYNESKRLGESIIFAYNERFKERHGIVRIFNTYGPRMKLNDGRVIIQFLRQAMKERKFDISGDGRQTRSFCYVDDLIDGVVEYARTDLTVPMNLGSDEEISIVELAHKVKHLFPEADLTINYQEMPQDDPTKRRPDLSFAKKHLQNWSPKISLDEGLKKTFDWLKDLDL